MALSGIELLEVASPRPYVGCVVGDVIVTANHSNAPEAVTLPAGGTYGLFDTATDTGRIFTGLGNYARPAMVACGGYALTVQNVTNPAAARGLITRIDPSTGFTASVQPTGAAFVNFGPPIAGDTWFTETRSTAGTIKTIWDIETLSPHDPPQPIANRSSGGGSGRLANGDVIVSSSNTVYIYDPVTAALKDGPIAYTAIGLFAAEIAPRTILHQQSNAFIIGNLDIGIVASVSSNINVGQNLAQYQNPAYDPATGWVYQWSADGQWIVCWNHHSNEWALEPPPTLRANRGSIFFVNGNLYAPSGDPL